MKAKTPTEYINATPKEARKHLREMRACLRKVAPGATESIKWGALALSYKRILFAYAAYKNHVSLMPTPPVIRAFKKELSNYKSGKGSIQFPLDKPLPLALIRKVAAYRVKESEEKDVRWM
jgi:uncharacterized protein YdhG (YjbR/CyaY superfamily)